MTDTTTFAQFLKDVGADDVHVPSTGKRGRTKKNEPVAWECTFKITKLDEEQMLCYGWASVIEKDGTAVVDHQDDLIYEKDLVEAVNDYMMNSRVGGEMHAIMGVSDVVQGLVFTHDVQKALGIDLGLVGWFVCYKVKDAATWAMIKDGTLRELSIGGTGVREKV